MSHRGHVACSLTLLALSCAPPGLTSGGDASTSSSGSDTSTSASETSTSETDTGVDITDCTDASRVVAGDVRVESAAQLAELADVVEIQGNLTIRDDDMVELVGLHCLERVQGTVYIAGNDALERIDAALERLRVVDRGLFIDDNPLLVSLTSLAALERIEGRTLIGSPVLLDLRLPALTFVGEHFTVEAGLLPDLHGLSALTEVAGRLAISSAALVDLDGLQQLAATGTSPIGGGLSIAYNQALLSLDGITLTAMPSLNIEGNPLLVDLAGLESVVEIGRSLTIEDNASLTSLQGLDNLVVVRGGDWLDGVSIVANPSLSTLAGLDGLDVIEQHLHVCDNPALDHMSALAGLSALGRMTVIYNDTLANAEPDAIAAAVPDIEWVKIDANGVLDPLWWDKPACPWSGDEICDESFEFQGDVGSDCEQDCCDLYGPTHLCAADSDDDCQDEPIGPGG